MAVSGQIAEGTIKIALAGLDAAKKQLASLTDSAQKLGTQLSTIGTTGSVGFATLTASVTGFLKAADPVRFEIFSQKLKILSAYIGLSFIPILIEAIEVLDKLIDYFKNLSDEQRENIEHWTKIALVVTGVVTGVASFIAIASKAIGVIRALTAIIGILEAETGIGLLLALAAVALGVLELSGGMEKLKPVIEKIEKVFSQLMNAVLGPFLDIIQQVAEQFISIFEDILKALIPIFKAIGEAFGMVFAAIKPIVEQVAGIFKQFVADLVPVFQELAKSFGEVFKQFLPIIQTVGKVFSAVGQQFGTIIQALIPVLSELATMFSKTFAQIAPLFDDLFKQFGSLVEEFLPVIEQLGKAFAQMAGTVGQFLVQLLPPLAQMGLAFVKLYTLYEATLAKVWMMILSAAAKVLPVVIDFWTELGGVIVDLLPTFVELAKSFGELFGAIAGLAGPLVNALMPLFKILLDISVDLYKSFIKLFGPVIIGAVRGMVAVIKVAVDAIVALMNAIIDGINAAIDAANALDPIGKDWKKVDRINTAPLPEEKGAGGGGDYGGEEDKKEKDKKDKEPGYLPSWILKPKADKETKEKTEKEKKEHTFVPMAQPVKVEHFALEDAFKRAQTGASFDPTKLYQNEMLKIQGRAADHLDSIDSKTKATPSTAEGAF